MSPRTATSPRQVERTYYLIAGVYTLSASLIWGINTLFLLHAGLSLMQAFMANAVFTGSMALFEVPTGIVADTRGRRLSFLLSVSLLLAGTLAYVAVLLAAACRFCAASVVLGSKSSPGRWRRLVDAPAAGAPSPDRALPAR